MNILNDQKNDKDKIVNEAQQKKELRHLASIRPHKGHTLFKFNLKTGVMASVNEDDFEETEVEIMNGNMVQRKVKKLNVESDTIYASALNAKNAEKKFRKQLASMGYLMGNKIEEDDTTSSDS